MAVGLFTLVPWRAFEAAGGREEPGRDGRLRRRLVSAGRAVVYLVLGILAVGVATRSGGGGAKQRADPLRATAGTALRPGLSGLSGLSVVAVGIAGSSRAVKQNFTEDLRSNISPMVCRPGAAGYVAKGIALRIVGALFRVRGR